MATPDYPSVKADVPAPPLSFIADLMQASPPLTTGPVLAILLALQVNRIRLFKAGPDGCTQVLERRVDRGVHDSDAETKVAKLTSLEEAVRDAVVELTKLGGVRSVDIALDLTVGTAHESLSSDLDTAPLLEGQNLSELSNPGVTPDAAAPESELHTEEFVTAADAAAMLGVSKSTITRRIRKGEIIGFCGFKKALRIPRDQFNHGDVVAGVAEILAQFPGDDESATFDHKEAWIFLCSTLYQGAPEPRPIDRLRAASRERPWQSIVAELVAVKESLDYGDHV